MVIKSISCNLCPLTNIELQLSTDILYYALIGIFPIRLLIFLCRSARIRTENLRQSSDYHVISMGFYHLNYGTLNILPAGNTYRIELGQYLTRLLDVVRTTGLEPVVMDPCKGSAVAAGPCSQK
mgnify:FL=1